MRRMPGVSGGLRAVELRRTPVNMEGADEYERRAEDAERRAAVTANADLRKDLVEVAKHWRLLAEHVRSNKRGQR